MAKKKSRSRASFGSVGRFDDVKSGGRSSKKKKKASNLTKAARSYVSGGSKGSSKSGKALRKYLRS